MQGVEAAKRLMSSKSTEEGWCLVACTQSVSGKVQVGSITVRYGTKLRQRRAGACQAAHRHAFGGCGMVVVRRAKVTRMLFFSSSAWKANSNCSSVW